MIHRVKRELLINVLNEGMKLKFSLKDVKEFGNENIIFSTFE